MKKTLKTALLLVSLLAATSCLKDPELKTDNGPEVSAEEVQNAVLNAWGEDDISVILKNEFLYIEQDQKIANLEPRVVYKESSQVIDRQIDTVNQKIHFKFAVRSQTFENGSFKPISAEETNMSGPYRPSSSGSLGEASRPEGKQGVFPESIEALQKSMAAGGVGLASSTSKQFIGSLVILNLLSLCEKSPTWDVSCHNLRVTEELRAPPAAVANSTNCAGIPNCQIRYKKVAFDLVVTFRDEETNSTRTEKVLYDLAISPDVPYLSRLMEYCYQGMVPTATQKVLVKMCNRVENYQAGQ